MRALEVTAWRSVATFAEHDCPVVWDRQTLQISNLSTEQAQELLRVLDAYADLKKRGAVGSGQFTLDAALARVTSGSGESSNTGGVAGSEMMSSQEPAIDRSTPVSPAKTTEEFPLNGLVCIDCGFPQRVTPSGDVCQHGHGGAPGISEQEYTRQGNSRGPADPTVTAPTAGTDVSVTPQNEAEDDAARFVDDVVRSASTLREVLCCWIDRGVTTKHDLVVLAERHSGEVPVLKRTRDLRGRVLNLLKSIDMPGLA